MTKSKPLDKVIAQPPVKPGPQRISIDLIDIAPNRLRPVNSDWAALMADKLAAGTRYPPIEIRPRTDSPGRYWLVIGGHRLEGHKLAGMTEIVAEIDELSDEDARLREIDENLDRAELNALDRALHLAERKRVWEKLHPQTRHGGDRKSRTNKSKNQVAESATRFTAEAAERIGLSERSIRIAVALADALSPKAIALARGTYLADHQSDLLALSKFSAADQLRAVKAVADGKAKSIRTALPALGRGTTKDDEQERLFQLVIANLPRMTKRTRRRVLDHWIGAYSAEVRKAADEAKTTTKPRGKGNGEAARQGTA